MGELARGKGQSGRIGHTTRVPTPTDQEPRTRLLLRHCGARRSRRSYRLPLFNLSGPSSFPVSLSKEAMLNVLPYEQRKPEYFPSSDNRPSMLHLPLTFPPSSSTLLTSWSTIAVPLATLLSQLPSLGAPTPDRFSCVLGLEVHANCRIRRIWFSNDGKEADEWMARKGLMSELAMYAKGTD